MSYYRKQEDKHRLNKLYNKTKNRYGAGAYYDDRKDRLIQYSCHNKNWKRAVDVRPDADLKE